MKTEIYNALAAINRGFDATLESLKTLHNEGVLTAEYLHQQTEITEEVRAGINHMILGQLEAREEEDWTHFGKMRSATDARLKES